MLGSVFDLNIMEEIRKQIIELLDEIIVFEAKFKKEILDKTEDLTEDRLKELEIILLEVKEWQQKTLEKILKEDPDFYNRILIARRQVEEKILNMYKQKIAAEDHEKMQIILNKIDSL